MEQLSALRELQMRTFQLLQSVSRQLDHVIDQLNVLLRETRAVKAEALATLEASIGFSACDRIAEGREPYVNAAGDFEGFTKRQEHFRKYTTERNAQEFD